MSYLHRLMPLVVIALVPVGAIQIYNAFDLRNRQEMEVSQQAERLLGLMEAEHVRLTDGLRQTLAAIRQTQFARNGDYTACQSFMDQLRTDTPDYIDFSVSDRSGTIRCGTEAKSVGTLFAGHPHFQPGMAGEAFVVGGYVRSPTTDAPVLPFAMPLRNPAGEITGVVSALLDTRWLAASAGAKRLPGNATLIVADRNGIVIGLLPEAPGLVGNRLPESFQALLMDSRGSTVEISGPDGVTRVLAYSPVATPPAGLFISVGIDKAAAMAPVDRTTTRSLIIIGIGLTFILALIWLGNRWFVRGPVQALVGATLRWREGDPAARVGPLGGAGDRSEFGTLARAFDAMAADLEAQSALGERAHRTALKMAEVLESTTDCVLDLDADWRLTYMNQRARDLAADGRDLTGQVIWEAFPEAVGTKFWHEYRRAMADQTPVTFETFYAPHSRWYAVRAFPSSNHGLAVYFQDVTERCGIEERLLEQEAQYRAIVETAVDAMLIIDERGTIRSFNPAAERIFGYNLVEVVGENIKMLMPEPYRSEHDGYLDHHRRTGERRIIGIGREVEGRRKDGTVFPLELAVAEWTVDDQRCFTGIMRDITGRRQAETALRASETRYRTLAQALPQLVWSCLPDGSCDFLSPQWVSYTGRPEAGQLGAGWLDAIHPDDRDPMAAHWRRSVDGGAPFDTEVRIRAADGTYRWFKQRAVPLGEADGVVRQWLGTSTDISDVIETREALRAAKEAAEGASMAKSRFLASASHDLRQPMQALFFFSSALEDHIDDAVGKDNLMHLERGLDALKGLLDSLLDISQLDAGVVRPTIEDFPVVMLLDHLTASYAPVARGKGLDWCVVPCSLTVRSDRVLLGRILGNLIENAVRYTERGRILVDCHPVGERLVIEVRDTGIGIPEDQMRSIWGEFHQVGNPERDRSQGLGLGLAIVERISRLLGYRTEVKSRPGEGSSFSVEVPLGEAQAVAEPPPTLPAERGRGRCALVVDDDAIILLGLQTMLSTWGYEVIIAADTEQAIRRLEAVGRVPDIIVADYRLREGRVGTEVVARIRALCGKQIPGVILTGETASECQHEVVSLGLGLAFKPITARQLSLTIEKYLEAAE